MKDFRWRSSFYALAVAVLFSVGFGATYFGAASAADVALGGFVVASIAVGVFELWPSMWDRAADAFRRTFRRAYVWAWLRYDSLVMTMFRLRGGKHQRPPLIAPGHSWRSCAST